MGTGKSAVGRNVAQRLDLSFVDSDHAIEVAENRSIADIFESDGEKAFREMERVFISEGHPNSGCLVSCGGGLIIQSGMLELVKSKGPVVCLLASAETIYERTRHRKHRPLLNVEDPLERIRSMLSEREPIYRKAGTEVLTDGRSIVDVAAHVCRVYQSEARQWVAQ